MTTLPLAKTSQWNLTETTNFLSESRIPLRLACQGTQDFPLLCSVWYCYKEGAIWCASHESSHLIRLLKQNPNCGFEIGVNEPPYKGVRGQGVAELIREPAAEILADLIERYAIDPDSSLARWLTSRVAEEYAIRINIVRITSWDYTRRMLDSNTNRT